MRELADSHPLKLREAALQPAVLTERLEWKGIPAEKEMVHIDQAGGRICAMSIIPYPPGIPIACPGEVLSEGVLAYIKERRMADEKVIGVTSDFMIAVGRK
ncbi:MAG: hypothetical protein IJ443_04940 [Firmicutes bacterium]|nr:hypothetical protein [Bacillota bacterium]